MLALHAKHVPHALTAAAASPQCAVLSLLPLSSQPDLPLPVARRSPHSLLLLTALTAWAMLALPTPRTSRRRRIIAAPTMAAQPSLARALSSSCSLPFHTDARQPTALVVAVFSYRPPTVCHELTGSRSLFCCATVSCFWHAPRSLATSVIHTLLHCLHRQYGSFPVPPIWSGKPRTPYIPRSSEPLACSSLPPARSSLSPVSLPTHSLIDTESVCLITRRALFGNMTRVRVIRTALHEPPQHLRWPPHSADHP